MSEKEVEIINLAPPLTAEQLAKNAELQAELAARFDSPRTASPDAFARRAVADNLMILEALSAQFAAETSEEVKISLSDRAAALKAETAMWLKSLGEFARAAELAPSAADTEKYLSFLAAEERDDSDWCAHNRWRESGVSDALVPNYYIEFDYYSPARGEKLSMVRCAECGARNAHKTPQDLQSLRDLRRNLRAAQTGEDLAADRAAVLSSDLTVAVEAGVNLSQTLNLK